MIDDVAGNVGAVWGRQRLDQYWSELCWPLSTTAKLLTINLFESWAALDLSMKTSLNVVGGGGEDGKLAQSRAGLFVHKSFRLPGPTHSVDVILWQSLTTVFPTSITHLQRSSLR